MRYVLTLHVLEGIEQCLSFFSRQFEHLEASDESPLVGEVRFAFPDMPLNHLKVSLSRAHSEGIT
jgi:hypothetical protein